MNREKTINFIALLRGPAALLVVWDHLIAGWTDGNNIVWKPVVIVREYINKPLGIIQDFGFLGVSLFFLVSGFIITFVLQRENHRQFMVKRFFRIYPPFVLSIIFIVAFYMIYDFAVSQTSVIGSRSVVDVLWSMTLLNYFSIPQNPVNGVAWTLIIEIVFYALCFLFIPLIKKMPRMAVVAGLLFSLIIIYFCRAFGDHFFLFAAVVAYIPYLIMGQIIYYVWSEKITFRDYLILSVICYFVLIRGIMTIHNEFYSSANSYGVSFFYAYLIFLLAMLLEKHIRTDNICGYFSDISYSLYLYHGDIGFIFLALLYPLVGVSPAILLSLILAIGISYLSYRLVEQPSQKFARKLLS